MRFCATHSTTSRSAGSSSAGAQRTLRRRRHALVETDAERNRVDLVRREGA